MYLEYCKQYIASSSNYILQLKQINSDSSLTATSCQQLEIFSKLDGIDNMCCFHSSKITVSFDIKKSEERNLKKLLETLRQTNWDGFVCLKLVSPRNKKM